MHIENVVIDSPIVNPSVIFSDNNDDWINNERIKTYYTSERFLPKILKEIGFVQSTSEVRRNKPKLCITLDKPDFLEVKWGKKKCWILVGLNKEQEYRNKAFKLNEGHEEYTPRDIDINYINKMTGRDKL